MKKLIFILFCSIACIASAHGPGPGPRRPAPPPPHHHPAPRHHGSSYFWSGFADGVVGGLVGSVIRPTTTIVQQPVVVTTPAPQSTVLVQSSNAPKQVWVEGHYEIKIVNGISTKIWIPGHFVIVQ